MREFSVGIFNDSFPPTIDGVANAAVNYAKAIQKNHGRVVVATPWYPKIQDDYPFEVVRYPSIYISKRIGYRAGYPFDPLVVKHLEKKKLDILHTHCPFVSTGLARVLRAVTGAPIVFTYHTKFDIDIERRVESDTMRRAAVKFILNNINACDDVWVVSEGAGENLRSLGYTGDYIIMQNGTDFAKGRATEEQIRELEQSLGLAPEETVFLFVGRMMWYKGVRLSIDGLAKAKEQGAQFKMVFVGEGMDRPDIMDYTAKLGLEENCIFTGAIRDRELLRVYFSRANLFLFPSTYDTNGIVVKEAAACSCPSLLVEKSCAAEGITHDRNGILIEESIPSMTQALLAACGDIGRLRRIGKTAAEEIYLSWDDAVEIAYQRYAHVLKNVPRKKDIIVPNRASIQRILRIMKQNYRRTVIQARRSYRTSEEKMRGRLEKLEDFWK
jgi:1,2-diacylglycerol 3-alpha-glucosyltransferase